MANFATNAGLLVMVLTSACFPILGQTSGPKPDPASENGQEADRSSVERQNPLTDSRDRIYYPGDTERFKPLARKLMGNLLLDQKEIWTSPFHMHAEDAKWWIGLGGLTAALIATDRRTSTLLENSKGQVTWGNNLSTIGTTYTLLPLIAGFYSYGVLRDEPKAREAGVLGGEALLDSLIVVEVLKPVAGRNRPDSQVEKGRFFQSGTSFPSGHAIESWSLASLLSYEYGHTKIVPIIACGLAGVVSVSRFAAQKHFASDIVAGGAMGWFIGRYVWKTHQDHAIHHHALLKPRILPQLEPGSRTYAVAVRFEE
jgi:membrane-associated phospholipid phosphatase